MGFSRQKYWSGLTFFPLGDLPDPGIEPRSPALAGWFFTTEPLGKPLSLVNYFINSRVYMPIPTSQFIPPLHLSPLSTVYEEFIFCMPWDIWREILQSWSNCTILEVTKNSGSLPLTLLSLAYGFPSFGEKTVSLQNSCCPTDRKKGWTKRQGMHQVIVLLLNYLFHPVACEILVPWPEMILCLCNGGMES